MTVQDTGKPTLAELGINPAALAWHRSGDAEGSIEVAFPVSPRWNRGDWVLLRVAGDPAGRILVFDRNEWDCFIDGARKGEFDDAADGEFGGNGGPRCQASTAWTRLAQLGRTCPPSARPSAG